MTLDRELLTIWWERNNEMRRQSLVPNYSMPHDGASFVIMNNFMSIGGFGDDRIGHQERLSALMLMARETIRDKFIELWPKRETWKGQ